ncbi:MAG TPA: entericidin A/B family lipoprotein [Geminicoccus sp.]|uniref:entericidin A/B family lipoprotein n=1 Tax=Geminicoccus sp. TaxID=2024832 RepID=UPI002E30AEDD|nr:entericidin A/B family lipoprotein [Geminicoccus sp.]HEX2526070.1 entericidin A/B family lipoprotein [Geminicoccus sp.]
MAITLGPVCGIHGRLSSVKARSKEPDHPENVLLHEAVKWLLTSETWMSINKLSPDLRATFLRFMMAVAVLMSLGTLAACNTMEGAGEDISAGGDALEDTAGDVKDSM